MKKLLVVDGCIGEGGVYARRMLDAFLAQTPKEYTVERVDLNTQLLVPFDGAQLAKREKYIAAGKFSDPMFSLARQFASADLIVIAAPKWYENLPAKLMTYLDHAICPGISFGKRQYGSFQKLCKARVLVFITARGSDNTDQYSWEQTYFSGLSISIGMGFQTASVCGLYGVSPESVEYYLKSGCRAAQALWQKVL